MAGMYPNNQELTVNGEQIMWPGVDSTGKFTNGDFNDPLVPPSFIPAESINLILDNLSELIKRCGCVPNNTSVTQLADAIDKRFIDIFKNGYFQMPGMPSPLEDENLHFEGYSWHEVNYDGNFFRAKGRNAKAFSSVKLTAEQIKNGTYAFGADEQGDAIREIWGSQVLYGNEIFGISYGGFSIDSWNNQYSGRHVEGGMSQVGTLEFRASKVEGVNVAEEIRSRNLTFTIWVLVKNE